MAKFITDNGIFNYASSGKQEYRSVLKYFKTAALEELMKNGYEMGINTPWGEEVTKLYRHKELSNRYDDEEDIDLDEEYYNVYAYGCIGPSFAVVGTMKDIVELCKDCEMVDGWYFQFLPAPRPDLVEVAREAGDYVFWDYQGFMWSRMEVLGEEESIIKTVEVS